MKLNAVSRTNMASSYLHSRVQLLLVICPLATIAGRSVPLSVVLTHEGTPRDLGKFIDATGAVPVTVAQ